MNPKKKTAEQSTLPQVFTQNPIFASKPQKGMREVQLPNGDIWKIGVKDPFSRDLEPKPALDVRHGKLLAIIFSKFKIDRKVKMEFSVRELARAMYGDNFNSKQKINIIKLLGDMRDTWLSTQIDGATIPFPLIKYIQASKGGKNKKKGRNQEDIFYLDYIEFHELFIDYMNNYMKDMFDINLYQLLNIHNRIVAAIYLYIPSRAVKFNKKPMNNTFDITLTKLLADIGETVPKKKSDRKRKFQHFRKDKPEKSIDLVTELNNLVVSDGRNLRCQLIETKDKKDWKLCFWVLGNKIKIKPRNSSIFRHFRIGKLKANSSISEDKIVDIWYYKLKHLDDENFNFGFSEKYLGNVNDAENDKSLKMLFCLMGGDWFNSVLHKVNEKNIDIEKWHESKKLIMNYCLVELAGDNMNNYNPDIINVNQTLNLEEKKILAKYEKLSEKDKIDLSDHAQHEEYLNFNYLFPNEKDKIEVFQFHKNMKEIRTKLIGKEKCDKLSKG